MRYTFVAMLVAAALVSALSVFTSCNETADETQQAGKGAVGIAEKMSEGTVGDADEEGEDY